MKIFRTVLIFLFLGFYSQLSCQFYNTSYGNNAGSGGNGDENSFFGYYTGYNNSEGSYNNFFGSSAGFYNTTGDKNVYNGAGAGASGQSSSFNCFVGYQAGFYNTADNNNFFGSSSGYNNTIGNNNAYFGHKAGYENEVGFQNSFFGNHSGEKTEGLSHVYYTGCGNAFHGTFSGQNNTIGYSNSFFGTESGHANESGYGNTYIGSRSGLHATGNRNIVIGSSAGPTPSNSNIDQRLFIHNHETDTPLIYGEFENDFVMINGTFEVTGGVNTTCDINRKNNFLPIDTYAILEKVATLPIQQWTYKDHMDEKHIGAMAQDFYAAFGLGSGETTISTIDADGVALAAIQALKKENDQLKTTISELQTRMESIEKLITGKK